MRKTWGGATTRLVNNNNGAMVSGTAPTTAGGPHRRRHLRLLVAGWVALYLAVSMVIGGRATAAHADAQKSDLPVASLLNTGATGVRTVFVDEATKRIIQIRAPGNISIWDATLHPVAFDKPLPNGFQVPSSGFRNAAFAWDPGKRQAYLVAYPSTTDVQANTNPTLLVLDGDMNLISSKPLAAFTPGLIITGMSYYSRENKLYLVAQMGDVVGTNGYEHVQVAEVDATTATSTWPQAYTVPSCQKSISTQYEAAIVRSSVEPTVFIGCGTGNLVEAQEPGVPGVAAIDVSKPASVSSAFYPLSGAYHLGESLYDAESRRLILIAAGAGVSVQSARIFDLDHRVFLGKVGAGNINVAGAGIDPTGGRIYVLLDHAVLIGSQRGITIPQADQYYVPTTNPGPVVPVRFNHTLMVPTSVDDKQNLIYTVYRNPAPDYVAPATSDPDALTTGGPEQPGKTDVNFAAEGKAFGARALDLGGLNGVLQNILSFQGDWWTYINTEGNTNVVPYQTGLNDGDRDLYFSRVNRAFLSQTESSATSISTDADAATRSDWDTATKQPNSGQPGQPWPSQPAACVDNGAGAEPGVTSDGSKATCNERGTTTDAKAVHDNAPSFSDATNPVISFGSSTSDVHLVRDPKLGAVSVATAEVKDINIGGVVHIGHVISTSTASAKGTPGTAHTTYNRHFDKVSMPGYSCNSDCNPQDVVDNANHVLGPKFVFELPTFEQIATPHGALASVQREPWQHQQDVAINDQSQTESQTAALRVTQVNDNTQASREVFEFAATEADATYAIYVVDNFDDGGVPDAPAASAGPSATGDLSAASAAPSVDQSLPTATEPSSQTKDSSGGGGNLIQRFLRRLGHGLRLLLTGKHDTLLNLALWALLFTPVFLSTRRRYLLRLIGEYTS